MFIVSYLQGSATDAPLLPTIRGRLLHKHSLSLWLQREATISSSIHRSLGQLLEVRFEDAHFLITRNGCTNEGKFLIQRRRANHKQKSLGFPDRHSVYGQIDTISRAWDCAQNTALRDPRDEQNWKLMYEWRRESSQEDIREKQEQSLINWGQGISEFRLRAQLPRKYMG